MAPPEQSNNTMDRHRYTLRASHKSSLHKSSASDSASTSMNDTYNHINVPQLLLDNEIYGPANSNPPANFHSILERMDLDRSSLSPTPTLKRTYDTFVKDNDAATNDATVSQRVMRHIAGSSDYPSAQEVRFLNLQPLTAADQPRLPPPYPSSYDGIPPSHLHPAIRVACQNQIVPNPGDPILPNWFQETRGPDTPPTILRTSATYNGAFGARAMDTLRSYGQLEQPGGNTEAHSFGATYLDGTLNLYSTHSEQHQALGGGRSYHTTRLASESLTGSFQQFRRGARMFRNLRSLASEERERAVSHANVLRSVAADQPPTHPGPGNPRMAFHNPASSVSMNLDPKNQAFSRRSRFVHRAGRAGVTSSNVHDTAGDLAMQSEIEDGYERDGEDLHDESDDVDLPW